MFLLYFYIIAVHHCLSVCAYSEAALEAFANHVQSDWVYAWVHWCHVDPDIIKNQEETTGKQKHKQTNKQAHYY